MSKQASRIPLFGLIFLSVFILGFSNSSQSNNQLQTDFKTDSLAPFGAYPEEKFQTTVSYDPGTETYLFEYRGDHDITYSLPINDPITQKGLIKIGAQVDTSAMVYPVVNGGTRYRTGSGQILDPEDFAKTAKVVLANSTLENNTLSLTYQETLAGITTTKTFEYTLQGKTLVLHATSSLTRGAGNYYGFSFGQSQNTPTPSVHVLPYTIDPIVAFADRWFYSVYLDRGKSSSVNFQTIIKVLTDTSVQAYALSTSSPDSKGNIAALDETGYITVSDDVLDVLPKINHPSSPYRQLLNDKVVLDIWGVKPSDFETRLGGDSIWVASQKMLDYFQEYGFTNLAVIYHDWQRYGNDIKLPVHFPANPNYGTDAEFTQFIKTAKDLGYLIALHENYVDVYPDSPAYSQADLARNADLSFKQAVYNKVLKQQAFVLAGDKAVKYADQQGQLIRNSYAPNATFLDVSTSLIPTRSLDFNANNPVAKSFSEADREMKVLFLHQKTLYQGPLFGEGRSDRDEYDSFYAGYVDGVERQIDGNYLANIIPDFELQAVKPLMANQGMGYYGRYFVPPAAAQQLIFPDQVDWDQYRASEIAYGHTGFISNATLANTSFPMGNIQEASTEYYMLQQFQGQYLASKPIAIEYEDNGKFVSLSQALIDNIDFMNPHLSIQYDNGLNIYLNFNRGSSWAVNAEGTNYILPSMGWVAWNPNIDFLEYSSLVNGQRVDYAQTPLYTFARSRMGFVQTTDKITTDGTTSVKDSLIPGDHDIHMVEGSLISYGDPANTILQTSNKCDVNLQYQTSDLIRFSVRKITSGPAVTLTYFDLPKDWLDANDRLPTDQSIKVWQMDPSYQDIREPLDWHASPDGKDLIIDNLDEYHIYEIEHVAAKALPKTSTPTPLPASKQSSPQIDRRMLDILAGLFVLIVVVGLLLWLRRRNQSARQNENGNHP